ncbi:phenylacetaldoxime dehydratase [Fusarium sp. NRRL 52700]|nr:phenylacetaldoxime dehydratase [Fusarium sp. NRRL 52700]
MLRPRFSAAHHFTLGIFGCQYHADTPSTEKLVLIEKFDNLIEDTSVPVERLEQNNIPSRSWWESDATKSFWVSLPDDAGFWRESVCLPPTRATHECTGKDPVGFGHCGELVPLTEKTGYWGAYRSRMTADFEGDTFSFSSDDWHPPKPMTDRIRRGRARITKFPDNLCIVIEGQDYSAMKEKEREVTNVVTAGMEKGMVSARACHAFAGEKSLGATNGTTSNGTSNGTANGAVKGTPNGGIFPGLDYIPQAQILYWTDLSKMEHMGRWDKGHVKLRRNFMSAYGPGGVMQGGDILLWVDLGILKGDEIDAEYVGCYESTGFLAFDERDVRERECRCA